MKRLDPSVTAISYLDDRLLVAPSWEILEQCLTTTVNFDKAFGPVLNYGKTKRGVAHASGKCRPKMHCDALEQGAGGLLDIDCVMTFKYLGTDIMLGGRVSNPVAADRAAGFAKRCVDIRMLPRATRGAALCDAIAGLWLPGGICLNSNQIDALVYKGFEALTGSNATVGQAQLRSRAIMHALGPSVHRTHVACAMIYAWLSGWMRARLKGNLSSEAWNLRWAARSLQWGGPVAQMSYALAWLGIKWSSATSLSWKFPTATDTYDLNYDLLPIDLANPCTNASKQMRAGNPAAVLHKCREFLARVVVMNEAYRRPKQFQGLERGLAMEPHELREGHAAMLLHRGGVSLATGGILTKLWISLLPDAECSKLCSRCGMETEDTMHRLWFCRHNAIARAILDIACPGNAFPNSLPACIARCGLMPFNVLVDYSFTVAQCDAIQQYLLYVNAVATQASVDERAGREVALSIDVPLALDRSQLYAVSAPPFKRFKGPRPLPSGVQEAPTLPLFLDRSLWEAVRTLTLATDGSSNQNDASGWGFTVDDPDCPNLLDYCGPSILDCTSDKHVGAWQHTNNVGELTAILLALRWILVATELPVTILYDSTYAANVTQRIFRPRANLSLTLMIWETYDMVKHRVTWKHHYSHTGHPLNERADKLANCGSAGIERGFDGMWRRPNLPDE
jgi:ribonuclease HI